jgi:D-cysteine desulfhydrase
MEQGADTIITCGAVQSNHCRLTASWAAKEGLDCHLLLEERVKGSYKKQGTGNNFLFELLGVKSIAAEKGGTDMMAAMEKIIPVPINRRRYDQLGINTGTATPFENFNCRSNF